MTALFQSNGDDPSVRVRYRHVPSRGEISRMAPQVHSSHQLAPLVQSSHQLIRSYVKSSSSTVAQHVAPTVVNNKPNVPRQNIASRNAKIL